MESVDRIRSTVTGSNKQRFSFVMMPISSNLHCKFLTWLGLLFQQGTQLVRFVGSDNPNPNTPWRSLEANRLKLFGSCCWASFFNFIVQCHGHWTWHFLNLVERVAKARLEHRGRRRLSREACRLMIGGLHHGPWKCCKWNWEERHFLMQAFVFAMAPQVLELSSQLVSTSTAANQEMTLYIYNLSYNMYCIV